MSTHIRTRQSARNATVAAQAAVILFVACGSVMAFKGLPGLEPSAPGQAGPDAVPGGEGPAQGAAPAQPKPKYEALHDPETVDDMFGMLSNYPLPAPEPEGGDTPPPPSGQDASPGVRYVGSIRVGGRAAAFMNIGGVTKLLRPGKTYEGVRLVRVDDDSVVVSIDDAPEQSIERTARSGSAVSLVTGGAPAGVKDAQTALGDDNPEPPNFTPDMSREERRAALLERARNERSRWERQRGDDGGPPN